LIADAGPEGGRYGRIRNVGHPLVGRKKIATLLRAFTSQDVPGLSIHERTLNDEPAVVVFQDGRAFSAILVAVADGKIRQVFVQIDPERLRHVGPPS
jgi:RNA polymerase sigma-70 factor (ECF subfamily)